jgi:hypothetical protein
MRKKPKHQSKPNPVARSLRLLGRRVVPSDKRYDRKQYKIESARRALSEFQTHTHFMDRWQSGRLR